MRANVINLLRSQDKPQPRKIHAKRMRRCMFGILLQRLFSHVASPLASDRYDWHRSGALCLAQMPALHRQRTLPSKDGAPPPNTCGPYLPVRLNESTAVELP
jgi:hypothetical protein